MKTKLAIIVGLMMLVSIFGLLIAPNGMVMKAKGQNNDPVLSDPDVYLDGDNVIFEVTYQDDDGDNGDVYVNFDWDYYDMETSDLDPFTGQRYSISYLKDDLNHDTAFWFDAFDNESAYAHLDNNYEDFLISDFITQGEWGFEPILSIPSVHLSGENVIFEVTYQHDNGEYGSVWLNFDYDDYYDMETTDSNPYTGQRYSISYPKANLTLDTDFWFDARDDQGEWAYLPMGYLRYLVSDFITPAQWASGSTDNEDAGDGSAPLGAGWLDNPEVIVAIIGLVAIGAGSGYAAYRKKKKRGHFSEMLTKLDDVYRSFKMNPHKCEIELEKMRALANEDLKRGVIDESNYTIVKDRIDDMITEIRGETLTTQVKDLPKDIEIRIKDMLIDGKLSRKEYDKLLPIITGSDMAAADKEKVQEMVEFWVNKDKKKVD